MVGHTGVFDAVVKAVETVDTCVGKVIDKVLEVGGVALLTADHGNCEKMSFEDGSPCTSHTSNLVAFSVVGDDYIHSQLKDNMALCDIAPTMLEIMGLEKPVEMTGESILNHD
jgi:2,3-bisphosphoglycerate-independent phosphoglycerate mutase